MNDHADTLRLADQFADRDTDARGRTEWTFDEHGLRDFIAALEAGRSGEADCACIYYGLGRAPDLCAKHKAAAAPQQPTGRSGEAGELKVVAEVWDIDGRVQTVWLGYHITDFVGQRLYAVPPTKDANNG